MSNKKKCPICGAENDQTVTGHPECAVCSFPYAYVARFSGKGAFSLWQSQIETRKHRLLVEMQQECKNKRLFSLKGGVITFRSPKNGNITIVTSSGSTQFDDETVEYFISETSNLNFAQLKIDGTVTASGNNDYSQCDTKGMAKISKLLYTPNCIYGITCDKSVVFSGQPASYSVRQWNNVENLVSGSYHVAALLTDGRVLVAGNMLNPSILNTVNSWKNIISVDASGDATIGLRQDGSVVFAGKENDPRRAAVRWKKIVDVALESAYAVGLTEDGSVLLAGESTNTFLDMGRKKAAEWKNIVAISVSRSGIAGLSFDGNIFVEGNVREKGKLISQWANLKDGFHMEMVQESTAT